MIPPEPGFLATSTPFRHGRPNPSLIRNLLSPVSAQHYTSRRKLQTLRRWNDSGFFGDNPEDGEPGPLPFLEREALVYSHKIFRYTTVGGKESEIVNMKRRFFLEGLRYRLSTRRVPEGKICKKDVYNILNACVRKYRVEVTAPEAQVILDVLRSSQECSSVQRVCRKDCSQISRVPGGMSPEYERRLFDPSWIKDVFGSEDSGVGLSFEKDSLSFTSNDDDRSRSFYKPLVPQEYDILSKLDKINGYEATSLLLSYLSPKDLQAVSSVGRQYRSIVLNDTRANQRRCNYLIEKRLAQENKHVAESKETNEDRVLFQVLGNKLKTLPKQPLANQSSKTILQSFIEAGKTIHRTEVLLKCPNCQFPSRRINGSRFCCTRQFCSYEFCRDCTRPFIDNHKCQKSDRMQDLPKIVVGSQKSRRNLRRL